jgi:hypothetical protein
VRGRALRAFACLPALALAFAGTAHSAEASIRCAVRGHAIGGLAGSRVLAARGDAVVYRVRRPAFDTYWACSRRHPQRVMMGRDDSYSKRHELYGPTKAFHEIRIAGSWITAIHEEDDSPECGKYGETGCEGRSTTLVIVNVTLALGGQEKIYFPGSETTRWLLSPEGGVAWLEEDELSGCLAAVVKGRLACPERTLWWGHVDPSSLHLSGSTLTWTSTDGVHSAAV